MESGLDRLNRLADDDARRELAPCCASPVWVEAVVAGRPYPDRESLIRRAAELLDGLTWEQLRVAVDAHPRIGERMRLDHSGSASREAAWSADEQSGMDGAAAEVRAALVEANRAYEERFGHVFLIFATGRTDTEMLAAARERLANDDATERTIVREQLGRIVALRLTKLVDAA